MEEEKTVKAEEPEKHKSQINSVVLVQTIVCALAIFLVVITGKLSPSTFDFLKKEYNEIMSVDMSPQEVVQSAASVVQSAVSVNASAAEPEEKEQEDKKEAVAVMASIGNVNDIVVPVHGRVSSEYGYRTNPISGAYALHTGLDIAADKGTAIVAAYNGVVKSTGVGAKSGKYVLMQHSDGSETLYCHCSEILVDEGAVINAGEPIALVGSTGWATGPHLHFEIRRNGNSIDPTTVLKVTDGRV